MSNRLFIGLLAVSLAASLSEACHPTGNIMTGTAGNGSQGTGNSSGAAGSGSAGTTGAAGTSGSAGTPGSAGSVSTTAGTTGSAGVIGSAGVSGATGSAGTTGAGGAVTTADMIDHMDDGDARIIMANGRQGPWHSFSEPAGGNIQPPIGTGFLPATGGVNSTSHAVHVTGSNYSFGGVGFDLNNSTTTPESMQSQPYNASAYNGITFWAKGSGTLRIEFPQRSFVPTDRGGSCTGSCWNVYGATTPTLTGNWQQITISWSGMQREQGGTSPAFTPNELMGVAFKAGASFDFWIDEVAFTRVGGTGGTTGRGGTTGSAGTVGSAGRGGTTGTAGTTGSGGTTGSAGTTGAGGTYNEPMPPAITSGGQNAWASRYWDCCKPACGWTGNTGGRTPIKSCSMSNQSLSTYTDRNACESGGTAYMCWNGAPFQVGPNLSYGFAAASGGNYSCGRCYQLQFTGAGQQGQNNSQLNGKMMIVQIINNGGVGADQFDLLIPGGGVGALNACGAQSSPGGQWNATNTDLGATYGGFLAGCNGDKNCVRQKCNTIFANKPDLMAGCDWFLGWFGGADNPKLIAKEITCPNLLKQHGLP